MKIEMLLPYSTAKMPISNLETGHKVQGGWAMKNWGWVTIF